MNNYYKDKTLYFKILLPGLLLIISSFKLVAQPIISSFSPQTAAAGTSITILGSQFNPVAGSDIVYFGNVRATVTNASANSIQVTVPLGATCLPISVTDIDVQLTGYSSDRFLPVFSGGASSSTTIAQSSVVSTNSGANTIFIKSADLDGDGKPDLIASYAAGNIGLFRNTSSPGNLDNNSFATEVDIFSGSHCTFVGIADMNGDGKQDLITYNQDAGELTVWQNQSAPGIIAFLKAVTLPDAGAAIGVGDIDGDGRPDLIQVDNLSPTLKLIKNNSTGGILDNTSFDSPVGFNSGNGIEFLDIQDLNGDGKPEIITCNRADNTLSVFENTAVAGIIDNSSLAASVEFPAGPGPFNLAIADIDADGKADLIVSNTDSNTISILKNGTSPGKIKNSSFSNPVSFKSGSKPALIDVGDLDGDGKPDIAVSNNLSGTSSVLKNITAAGVIDQTSFATKSDFTSGQKPYGIVIGDLDGDGKPEISVANQGSNTITIYQTSVNALPPVITRFSPDSAQAGQTVTIIGSHFSGTVQVKFGDSVAASFAATADTLITAVVGTGASGKIYVSTSLGEDSSGSFVFLQAPLLKSIFPLIAGKGDTIFIHGKYLLGTNAVSFGGIPATSFQVISDSILLAIVANGNSGSIQVTTPYGTSSKTGFIFVQPPQVTYFTPQSGGTGDTIYIHGKYLTTTKSVYLGGTLAAGYTVISDTLLLVRIGGGSTGSILLDNIGDTISVPGFIFQGFAQLSSFSPTSARQGDTVIIHGTNLTGTTAVYFGNVPASAFSVISDSVVYAKVGPGASGFVKLTTSVNSDSLSGFVFVVNLPHLNSFTPMSARQGDTVTIRGINLTGTTAVYFGNIPATNFTVISDSIVYAKVGTGASGYVKVVTPLGKDSLSGFVFVINLPNLNSFTPMSARQGDTVTIRGINLTGTTAVYFGNIPATNFTVISDSIIYAKVGTGASGYVKVVTPLGKDSLSGFVFVINLPSLISFTPPSARQGDTVTIRGYNLTGTTAVYFGNIPATNFTVISDSIVYAKVGTGASGYVKVVTPLGKDSLSGFVFVINLPSLISFTPPSARQGDTVTIRGYNLTGTTAVYFGNIPATNFTVISDSIIYAKVGTGASGYVKVVTPLGKDSLSGFVFVINLPHLNSFTPAKADSSITVSIKGINLTGTYAVDFGGIPATSFTVVSDSLITAIPGTGASGYVSVFTSLGSDSLSGFIYDSSSTQLPKIISFNPGSGSKDSVITIQGKYLSKVTGVSFGGTDAASFQIQSDSVITAVLGLGSSGSVTIRSASNRDSLDGFIYITAAIPPHIQTFTPDSGRSGTLVKILGSGFTNASVVSFGSVPAETFTVESDSLISATVGAGASGDVVVITPGGKATDSGFRFIARIVDSNFAFLGIGGFDTLAHVTVTWMVKNDKSITSYSIERGKDSLFFNSLNTQSSKQQDGLVIYDYVDMQPYTGVNYYRIRMQDTSGNVFYSPVLAYSFVNKHLLLYPNPATSYVMVVHPTSVYESVIRVLDQSGKTVRQAQVNPLVPETRLDISGIIPGTYTVSWTDGLTYIAQQLYIQH